MLKFSTTLNSLVAMCLDGQGGNFNISQLIVVYDN